MIFIEKCFYIDQAARDSKAALEILEQTLEHAMQVEESVANRSEFEESINQIKRSIDDARYLLGNSIQTMQCLSGEIDGGSTEEMIGANGSLSAIG